MLSFIRYPDQRAALPFLLLLISLGVTGCGPACRPGPTSGKDGPVNSAVHRQTEFDFYCDLRPPSTAVADAGMGMRPFAPSVYDTMKSHGYKVYLVRYHYERPVDPFVGSGGSFTGYGFRNFFGGYASEGKSGPRKITGQRAAVIWETRGGEFFLVDHYYASPRWLEGSTWLEKVRFYDPAAISVDLEKS